MVQFARSFRLSVVSLFGIIIPGFLILLLVIFGFATPVMMVAFDVLGNLFSEQRVFEAAGNNLLKIYQSNKFITWLFLIIVAYVVGYIIRLSSPDHLDIKSARQLYKKAEKIADEDAKKGAKDDVRIDFEQKPKPSEPEKGDHSSKKGAWRTFFKKKKPLPPIKGDKFPYRKYREYLEKRGLEKLVKLVVWGPDETDFKQRSKTHVNLLKIKIAALKPELSEIIESNEAHVRLLFGTWYAVKTSFWLTMIGIALTVIAGSLRLDSGLHGGSGFWPACYVYFMVSAALLLCGLLWAKEKIERQFHYQRVRELTQIIICASLLEKKEDDTDNSTQTESVDPERIIYPQFLWFPWPFHRIDSTEKVK